MGVRRYSLWVGEPTKYQIKGEKSINKLLALIELVGMLQFGLVVLVVVVMAKGATLGQCEDDNGRGVVRSVGQQEGTDKEAPTIGTDKRLVGNFL